MQRCAFLTMDDLTGFVAYDALARAPLADIGWSLDEISWRAPAVAWHEYDIVVIRTPWDYQNAPDEFLHVLERIAAATRLENGVRTVRWNLRKTYLRELETQGVRIVPTAWADMAGEGAIRAAFDTFDTDEIVLKPQIGANADDAIRLHRDAPDFDDSVRYAARLFAARGHMIQPFVQSVVAEGELSLILFRGEYCHAIRKTPKPGDFRVQEEHGGVITAVVPEPSLRQAAEQAMNAVAQATGGVQPLYARADFVRMPDAGFALMELELIEPSLYLSYDADAPGRFARAIDAAARQS